LIQMDAQIDPHLTGFISRLARDD